MLLYKSLVRVHGHSVCCPHSVTAIESLEKVQKRATKLILGFEKFSYIERLRKCELPKLKYRRIRGDMIETYKIITGIYDREASPVLKLNLSTKTRGNLYKLDGQGKARREAARRRNSECKINLSSRNSSRSNGSRPTAQR